MIERKMIERNEQTIDMMIGELNRQLMSDKAVRLVLENGHWLDITEERSPHRTEYCYMLDDGRFRFYTYKELSSQMHFMLRNLKNGLFDENGLELEAYFERR